MPKISCPSCGAPVDFKSGASILAVCDYCHSTLVRHDVNVEDIGKMAELKVDGSPLQIGAQGRYRGMNFGIIGRIQLRYDRGIWNEWHIMFDDGRTAWLGEAQGIYAVSFLSQVTSPVPAFEALRAGRKLQLKGQWFEVQDLESARCVAGEGELPFKVGAGYDAPVADLVADKNGFATIDYSETPPLVFIGEYMEFDDLHFSNLRQFDGWS